MPPQSIIFVLLAESHNQQGYPHLVAMSNTIALQQPSVTIQCFLRTNKMLLKCYVLHLNDIYDYYSINVQLCSNYNSFWMRTNLVTSPFSSSLPYTVILGNSAGS